MTDNLDKVVYIDKAERKNETFTTALKHRLQEMAEIGDTGYAREVVITVPAKLATSPEGSKFLEIAGKIKRDTSLGVLVDAEPKQINGKDEKIAILDMVFTISSQSKIAEVINKYLS